MRNIKRVAIVFVIVAGAFAQLLQPEGAQVDLYFPQFADGGQWQTTFTFVNAGLSPAAVTLLLLNDDGRPLSLDLGAGSASRFDFRVPPGGIRVLRSKGDSPATQVGWAVAFSSVPLQATVAFRVIVDGVPKQEITAQPTLPTLGYISAANRSLGVALANVYTNVSVSVRLIVQDSEGRMIAGPSNVSIPAAGHVSFNLWDKFPDLSDAPAVLRITSANPPDDVFVAWTLNSDASGVRSSLPPGPLSWPISHRDRIRDVHQQVFDAAVRLRVLGAPPDLQILSQGVNAYAQGGQTVAITLGLSQLISDSPSELAFVLGHELGHIVQQRNGGLRAFDPNAEFDADVWGTLLALLAGYDPYGSAGALAKLSMATGRAGLTTQFEEQLSDEAHKSFNTRLEKIFDMLVQVCNLPDAQQDCRKYKSIIHPNLPPGAPLLKPIVGEDLGVRQE